MLRVVRNVSHPLVIPAVLLSVSMVFGITSAGFGSFQWQTFNSQKRLDAIFVLSGGHSNDSKPPEWTVRRVEKAYELLMAHGEPYPKIVCVGGGGTANRPMKNKYGHWVPECTLCSMYLHEKRGVDYNLLLREYTSHCTLGNGFFSLLNHVLPANWTNIAVVTSEFHMPRAKLIFEYIYGLPGAGVGHGVHSKVSGSKAQGFHLQYHDVSDKGFNQTELQERKDLELKFIDSLKALSKEAVTLSQLHHWMMVENKGYNTAAQHLYGKPRENQTATGGLY